MDPFSIATGVFGVIMPLAQACTTAYAMYTAARNAGEDWEYLDYRRRLTEEQFNDWKRKMELQSNGLSEFLGPESNKYLLVLEILVKIAQCFQEINEFNSTHETNQPRVGSSELPKNAETFSFRNSKSQGQKKSKSRRFWQFISKASPQSSLPDPTGSSSTTAVNFIPVSVSAASVASTNIPTASGSATNTDVHFPSAEMLQIIPELALSDEAAFRSSVEWYKRNVRKFQESISTVSQVRWVLSDKERLTQVIIQLEKYNEDLFKITKDVIENRAQVPPVSNLNSSFQEFSVGIKLPFQRNCKFCGRADILDRMARILELGDLTTPLGESSEMGADVRAKIGRKSVVLHGMGGMGKSQIALEFAHRFSRRFSSILWIDAEEFSRTTNSACKVLEQIVRHYRSKWQSSPDLQQISNILGIDIGSSGTISQSSTKLAMEAVNNWLSKSENRGWLLLVDNSDNPKDGDLEKIIPTCDWGSVVITTRLRNLQNYGVRVAVEEIGQDTGLGLLLNSSEKTEQDLDESELGEGREIVKTLGELPLALHQAGSYIYSLKISFSSYRKRLDQGMKVGFKRLHDPSLPGNKASVLTTWELSFEALDDNARQLLSLCAFFSNEDIPEEFFRRGKNAIDWIKQDETKLNDAIRTLLAFSLVNRKTDDSFWIHSLVHTWVRERNDNTTQQRNVEDALSVVAASIVTDEHKRSTEDWIFEGRILSHLKVCEGHISKYFSDSDNIKVAEASFAIGYAYKEMRYYVQAEELYRRAIAVYEKARGKDHPSSLDTIQCMAYVLYVQERNDEALELYKRVLDGKEKASGRDHPSIFNVLNDMALVITSQGRHEEALEMLRRALDGKEKALGNDHFSTLETIQVIGNVFEAQGKYDDALQWYQRALVGMKKTLGNYHPSTLIVVNNIGDVFYNQEKYEEALEWYYRALAGREKTLGNDHADTLIVVNNIGLVFYSRRKYDEALEWYHRALAGREKTLGNDHANTLIVVNNIGDVFYNQEKYEEALEWYHRALAGREKTLGNDHADTLIVVNDIGLVFYSRRKYDEALEWYHRALAGREKTLGNDHADTLTSRRVIANCKSLLQARIS